MVINSLYCFRGGFRLGRILRIERQRDTKWKPAFEVLQSNDMDLLENIRVYYNYFCCRLGILGKKVLPRDIIRMRREYENNDPLVDISSNKDFFFKENIQRPVWLRSQAYKRLITAAEDLPDGLYLKIYVAYRSLARQRQQWERRLIETRNEYPNLHESEIIRLTRIKVAEPTEGFGGHQTGGAIDITLCNVNGQDLDMGEEISVHNEKTPTINKYISSEQLNNRMILRKTLEKVGFKNFPAEWWHFSYGDKMWAAYSYKRVAIYGYIEPERIKNKTEA